MRIHRAEVDLLMPPVSPPFSGHAPHPVGQLPGEVKNRPWVVGSKVGASVMLGLLRGGDLTLVARWQR